MGTYCDGTNGDLRRATAHRAALGFSVVFNSFLLGWGLVAALGKHATLCTLPKARRASLWKSFHTQPHRTPTHVQGGICREADNPPMRCQVPTLIPPFVSPLVSVAAKPGIRFVRTMKGNMRIHSTHKFP